MTFYRVSVRLSHTLHRRLQETARRTGMLQSEVVRKAIETQFAAEDAQLTAFDRFQQAGLVGIVKDAPADLSTNHKYFDGFGGS